MISIFKKTAQTSVYLKLESLEIRRREDEEEAKYHILIRLSWRKTGHE
jgi:hypothetical protein